MSRRKSTGKLSKRQTTALRKFVLASLDHPVGAPTLDKVATALREAAGRRARASAMPEGAQLEDVRALLEVYMRRPPKTRSPRLADRSLPPAALREMGLDEDEIDRIKRADARFAAAGELLAAIDRYRRVVAACGYPWTEDLAALEPFREMIARRAPPRREAHDPPPLASEHQAAQLVARLVIASFAETDLPPPRPRPLSRMVAALLALTGVSVPPETVRRVIQPTGSAAPATIEPAGPENL